jgi:hypothetical protein
VILTQNADLKIRKAVQEKIEVLKGTKNAYQMKYARLDASQSSQWGKIAKVMNDIHCLECTLSELGNALAKKDIGLYLIQAAYSYLDDKESNISSNILCCLKEA